MYAWDSQAGAASMVGSPCGPCCPSHLSWEDEALEGFRPLSFLPLPACLLQAMWLCKHLNCNLLNVENLMGRELSQLASEARKYYRRFRVRLAPWGQGWGQSGPAAGLPGSLCPFSSPPHLSTSRFPLD